MIFGDLCHVVILQNAQCMIHKGACINICYAYQDKLCMRTNSWHNQDYLMYVIAIQVPIFSYLKASCVNI